MVDSAGKPHERCGYEDAIYEQQRSLLLAFLVCYMPLARFCSPSVKLETVLR